jgi:hypothetical protein
MLTWLVVLVSWRVRVQDWCPGQQLLLWVTLLRPLRSVLPAVCGHQPQPQLLRCCHALLWVQLLLLVAAVAAVVMAAAAAMLPSLLLLACALLPQQCRLRRRQLPLQLHALKVCGADQRMLPTLLPLLLLLLLSPQLVAVQVQSCCRCATHHQQQQQQQRCPTPPLLSLVAALRRH